MNIKYSIRETLTKTTERMTQGRVQNVQFFIDCINTLINKCMAKIIFDHRVDWELLSLNELQTLVITQIRLLKAQIRNFSDSDELAKQIQIESCLFDIKKKLTQLSDPQVREYAKLIDLLET